MANTVSYLNNANTFGDWVVATNNLAAENNTLGKANYVKDTGTLYLSDPFLGLQVANVAIIGGQLQVQGIGSSAYIQNNIRVSGQTYLENTSLSMVASGDVQVAGKLSANASGLGLSVANNTVLGGTLSVAGATTVSNTLIVTKSTQLQNTLTVLQSSVFDANVAMHRDLQVDGDIYNQDQYSTSIKTNTLIVDGSTTLNNGASIYGQLLIGGNFIISGQTVYDANSFSLNANNAYGATSTYAVNRGFSGANAEIRWNETAKYWDLRDVNNTNQSLSYSKILTANLISDSVLLADSSRIASSAAANSLYDSVLTLTDTTVTLNNRITSVNTALSTSIGALANSLTNTIATGVVPAYSRANTSSNTFVGTTGTIASANAGVIRFTGNWGVTATATSNTINIATPQNLQVNASPTFASLSLTAPLALTQGGTNATSAGGALTNLLPSGTVAGYVLTTGGLGTYYWSPGGSGGGGGATPGTSINSTRLFPTVNNGQTLYTTPTYIPGSSQLRVYVNGVRQMNSEYTETSNVSVTLGTASSSGDIVLIEVDGYILTPYYANNISFTAPSGAIPGTANTIQLAIDNVEARKAALSGADFTGLVKGLTVATAASNTAFATTAYVRNVLGASESFALNAATVTNGVYNNGTYNDPAWITGLAGTKISGVVSQAGSLTTGNNYQMNALWVGSGTPTHTGNEIKAVGNITAYVSDERLKIKLGNIENALDKVTQLSGFYYELNEVANELGLYSREGREVGVSAQEVQAVQPEAVTHAPVSDKYLTVRYERLVPLLIEAIKELKDQVDELKGQIK